MPLRRTLIIAVLLVILAIGIYVGLGYFSTQKSIQRLTGWAVPPTAVLRAKNAEGDPFGGERNFVFDLPISALPDDAYCASLNLPTYSQGSAQTVQIPAGKLTVPKLDADPVCSRKEIDKRRKTALSIEATRKTLVIRWIYM
jgi:hypothetical protein